ncbi:hypothetical protein [Streptomyces sp. NPDC005573]|uniref:hypothetical protein n=1 Tax=Streptomyces sp. NPDC005573 TaxID=3156890 RepID=UPI0033A3E8A3
MNATSRPPLSVRHRTDAALVHLGLPAALLGIAVAGHLLAPAGPLRALLVAPALLWVPGRSLMAGLRPAGAAAAVTAALSVVLSLVALTAAGLLCQAVTGRVPLAVLPLWVSAVLLPLNLREWRAEHPAAPLALLAKARPVAVFGVAGTASAALLALVFIHLPTTAQHPYLSFSLAGEYTRIDGVLPVRAGQGLTIPVAVSASPAGTLPENLAVVTEVDGRTVGEPVPVTDAGAGHGGAAVHVRVPHGCKHQVMLRLTRGGKNLRSVDVYLRTRDVPNCARG